MTSRQKESLFLSSGCFSFSNQVQIQMTNVLKHIQNSRRNFQHCDLIISITSPRIKQVSLKLHSLILSQSSLKPDVISDCPYVDLDSINIAIDYLYGFDVPLLKDYLPLLSASMILGIPSLVNLTASLLSKSISNDNIIKITQFASLYSKSSIYSALKSSIVSYLVNTTCPIDKTSLEYNEKVDLFSKLDFEWLKLVLESPNFGSSMNVYLFSKSIILKRNGVFGDENVLLSFGGESAIKFCVQRNSQRAVWKVSDQV